MSGIAQHEPVGVGGGHGHLPERKAEAAGQLVGHPGSILRRQHGGQAGGRPGGQRLGHLSQSVTSHGPGVAQAEIDVVDAVDVDEVGAVSLGEGEWEGARPSVHPGHRDAAEEVAAT